MVAWLIGIGITCFVGSLLVSMSVRPGGIGDRLGRSAVFRWWAGSLAIAALGVGLALLFAWPAWRLGYFLGPFLGVSSPTGGALCACIFGSGGAALTGVLILIFNEGFENPAP